jgi:hypothetical protein
MVMSFLRRYQSITNWFQNQRSLAKKRKDDDGDAAVAPVHKSSKIQHSRDSRTFPVFPPPLPPPPLSSPSTHHHSPSPHSATIRARLSSSTSPHASTFHADPSLSSRSSTPSRSKTYPPLRTRRTRPEPYQLDALKDLFTRTSNPTIEERSALAEEIGMYVSTVSRLLYLLVFFQLKGILAKSRIGSGTSDKLPGNVPGKEMAMRIVTLVRPISLGRERRRQTRRHRHHPPTRRMMILWIWTTTTTITTNA